jgi:hypothetical protein
MGWEFRTTEHERHWGPGGVGATANYPASATAQRLATENFPHLWPMKLNGTGGIGPSLCPQFQLTRSTTTGFDRIGITEQRTSTY